MADNWSLDDLLPPDDDMPPASFDYSLDEYTAAGNALHRLSRNFGYYFGKYADVREAVMDISELLSSIDSADNIPDDEIPF